MSDHTQPELPAAVEADLDSMLSRKFGREVANYFAGIHRECPVALVNVFTDFVSEVPH